MIYKKQLQDHAENKPQTIAEGEMSRALAVYHGVFGRVTLYQLDRELATHAHREGHLVFHVSGKYGGMTVEGVRHELDQAAAAAVSPWQPHSFHPGDVENGSLFLVMYIRPEWFLEMSKHARFGLNFGASLIEMSVPVRQLVHQISSLLLDDASGELIQSSVFELTQESYDQSWESSSCDVQDEMPAAILRDYRIRNSIKLMKSRLGEGETILLDSIAREAGISRPHFFKLFKENVGLTPNIYLNTLRMETAIERLTQSNDAVTSIALDLGFSSQASFTRFFASNVGIPPSDYRKVAQLSA